MDIRKAFLDYFESKGHTKTASSLLCPNDATLLFTNAGMVQFKPIFTGETPAPNPPRAASCQTCLRAGGKHNDLENVGYTARHHTFFEMLGNFSFGDYFKEEAIAFAWEFLTKVVELPKDKLWVSIHESDDEAETIWLKYVAKERVKRFGDKDNFWQMGETGPCGPCSEIYFDQGAERFNSAEDYFGGDGDRFLEIWNLVFMQFNRDEKGVLRPLPKPSIDTGMGLERITAIKEGAFSNYDGSIFAPLLTAIVKIADKPYETQSGASHRVIADHIRAVTFLLAQGVNFDKEGRGYVLRRILRRGARHGYLLGLKSPFMYKLVAVLADQMKDSYPYLAERQAAVSEQIRLEEERFFATIENGMKLFNEEMAKKPIVFSGEIAFKLYDTFGFPLDLTQDMLRGSGVGLDTAGFEAAMSVQKKSAKEAWKGSGDKSAQGDFHALIESFGQNRFVGYDKLCVETEILALLDADFKRVDRLEANSEGYVLLKETPFYATSGGQIGDVGELKLGEKTAAIVTATDKYFGLNISKIKVASAIEAATPIVAQTSAARALTARHHSATHLLHAALNEILEQGASQAGSEVGAERLRFDFNYPKQVSKEQLEAIEAQVNELISLSIEAQTREMPIEKAKKLGAKALFGEKYGGIVRVVSFGEVSVEFCGGTHVKNASEIGLFAIVKESGVSAGVRRIEAVVSLAAYRYLKEFKNSHDLLVSRLKNPDPINAVDKLLAANKDQKKEIEKLQSGSDRQIEIIDANGAKIAIDIVNSADPKALVDDLKNRYEKIAVMLFSENEGAISVTAGIKGLNLKAGEWLKATLAEFGGKGGGRDDFASGGGIGAGALQAAKAKALTLVKERIG
ncbi:MAG: alanine--tRNA ligase [Helicobacteraceae bacterium]|jgi:alanyl-tRNA synthetase|nr:alanine--tRNA ligase [Helicobacteraceae bacterium]